jgi:hypothetical protein
MDIPSPPGRKPFIFEKFWITHPEFQSMDPNWWKEATIPHGFKMYHFLHKLNNFKQHLKMWKKKNFDNIFEAQRRLNDQMNLLQIQIINQVLTEKLKEKEALLKKQLDERCFQEEILWRKKYRIQWIQEGDRKTEFFHLSMIHQRHINCISHLVYDQGQFLQNHEDLE